MGVLGRSENRLVLDALDMALAARKPQRRPAFAVRNTRRSSASIKNIDRSLAMSEARSGSCGLLRLNWICCTSMRAKDHSRCEVDRRVRAHRQARTKPSNAIVRTEVRSAGSASHRNRAPLVIAAGRNGSAIAHCPRSATQAARRCSPEAARPAGPRRRRSAGAEGIQTDGHRGLTPSGRGIGASSRSSIHWPWLRRSVRHRTAAFQSPYTDDGARRRTGRRLGEAESTARPLPTQYSADGTPR
jgi:hypothetical protein